MIKTTFVSLDVTVVKSSVQTHTHIQRERGRALRGLTSQCVLRYTPRPTYPDSREWCCMPGPEKLWQY